MKRIIYILLLIPALCHAQVIYTPLKAAVAGAATGQTVKLNLYEGANPATTSGWNNQSTSDSPYNLVNTSGVTTTIQFVKGTVIGGNVNVYNTNSSVFTTNFPADVVKTNWYGDPGSTINFTITGLNNAKTYTVRTVSYDNGDDGGNTNITIGGVTQSLNPSNAAGELTFTGLTPTSGTFTCSFYASAGVYPVLNAIIIIEN